MKIGVCAKVTPDADARIKINGDGSGIDPTGVKFVVSDYDEYAVEEAIKTKEAHGGEVVAFSVGDSSNDRLIRGGCLALGADKAVIVSDDAAKGAGPLGVAKLLAAAIKNEGCELVFTGKAAIDDENGQVGIMLAELLGWAQISQVVEFSVDGDTVTALRMMDAGVRDRVTAKLPAVITCEDGLNTPRYAKLPDIMKAKRKPLAQTSSGDLGLDGDAIAARESVGNFAPPPARPAGRIIDGDAQTAAAELVRLLREEAKVL